MRQKDHIIEVPLSAYDVEKCKDPVLRIHNPTSSASLSKVYHLRFPLATSSSIGISEMAKKLLLTVLASCLVASTFSQITGTYPVQLTATGAPKPVDGTQLSNYPQCAVCD